MLRDAPAPWVRSSPRVRGEHHRLLHPPHGQRPFLRSGSSSVKLFLFKNSGTKARGKRDVL